MKRHASYVRFAVLAGIFILTFGAIMPDAGNLKDILAKLIRYTSYKPVEKLYLHLDRTQYSKSETIWFCAYLLNASSPAAGARSELIYVELLDERNNLLQRKILHTDDGVAPGDFLLPDSIADGAYVVRAYTNYMKNFEETWFFRQSIAIVSSGGNTQEHTVPSAKLDLRFFAEGGTFVAGFESRLAFKCTDENGDEVEIAGKILDEGKKVIASFATVHAGMGVVKIVPKEGARYTAVIEVNEETRTYNLPGVESLGYTLRAKDLGDSLRVTALTNDKNRFNHDGFLIIQSNGVPRFSAKGLFQHGALTAYVDKKLFTDGIAQITLLDDSWVPQCERLVFIDHQDPPAITTSFDKVEFKKREKITLRGQIRDAKALGIGGRLSVAVVDDAAENIVGDFPSNIRNTLLLTSDLKGTISEPGYYFKDNLRTTKDHLDLLMMVHGWRRFTWREVLTDSLAPVVYFPEKGLTLSGRTSVQAPTKKKEFPNTIKILTGEADVIVTKTDKFGVFTTDQMMYYDSTELIVETDDPRGEPRDLQLEMFPFAPPPPSLIANRVSGSHDASYFINQADNNRRVMNALKLEEGNTVLQGVVIKSSRIKNESRQEGTVLMPLATLSNRLTREQLLEGVPNVIEGMIGKVAGMEVSGNMGSGYTISIRRSPATVLFDGVRVDANFLGTLNKADVDHIDVIKEGGYGSVTGGPVVAVFSRRGATPEARAPGIVKVKYPGLSRVREFYSPNYSAADNKHKYPDYRSTIYWNPAVKTDASGNFEVSFYSADTPTKYNVVIEGLTSAKIPVTARNTVAVTK